jgi:transposase
MAMGKRMRLNEILDGAGFDRFVEEQCRQFYAPVMGRPSLAPGRYFRLLLIGDFEGLDSERGIAWRAAESPAVRHFLGLGLDRAAPDHSTIWATMLTAAEQLAAVHEAFRVAGSRGACCG